MENIIKFKSVNDNLVSLLEELLEEAKEGKIQDFIGVALLHNMDIMTVKCYSSQSKLFTLLGAITKAQAMLVEDIDS